MKRPKGGLSVRHIKLDTRTREFIELTTGQIQMPRGQLERLIKLTKTIPAISNAHLANFASIASKIDKKEGC